MLRPWSPELISSLVPQIADTYWTVRAFFTVQNVYILLVIVEGWTMFFLIILFVNITTKDVLSMLT